MRLVGLDGLEPSTSRLSGARSSHLSYRPVFSQALGSLHRADLVCRSLSLFFQTVSAGFEPLTRLRRVVRFLATIQLQQFSYHGVCRYPKIGGDEGIRTLDPLLAGQVLSQLSYTPIFMGLFLRILKLNPDN